MIANALLAAGAFGAALYCFVLSRRLRQFTDLQSGVGGAVTVLSAQVTELTRTLDAARDVAGKSVNDVAQATKEAEAAIQRLELMLASLHDVPEVSKPGTAFLQKSRMGGLRTK